MEEKLPIKRLSRLTWLQAIIIGFIFYLVVYNSGALGHIIPFTLLTTSGILLVGYADICLIIKPVYSTFFNKCMPKNQVQLPNGSGRIASRNFLVNQVIHMIEIFKTNVENERQAKKLFVLFNQHFSLRRNQL